MQTAGGRGSHTSMMQVILEGLNLHRSGRAVLREVDWRIGAGERWLVAGDSGAGKTQLLKIVSGDVWPDDSPRPARRYFRRGQWHEQPAEVRDAIAWLGPERQDRYERYGWNFTALAVVGTGIHRTDIPLQALKPGERARCLTLLRRAGIARLASRPFLTLSYGERRLVLLARAIAWRASLLLLDEVATGLDAGNRRRLFALLAGAALGGSGWICTAHRREDVPAGADHLLWLEQGRVRYAGPLRRALLDQLFGPVQPAARRGSRPRIAGGAAGSGRPLVEMTGASVWLDARRVLAGIDLVVRRGDCWVVHGGNGAGKSTLLRTLYGDHGVASGGSIRRAGIAPGVPLEHFRARTGLIAPHLQTEYPRHLDVLDTVVSGLHSSIGLNFRATVAEQRRARRSLAQFGLQEFAARPLAELSYGQLRRVLFARAAILRPRLLLLDEPFTGLNAQLRGELLELLEQWIGRGLTVVLATHYRSEWPRQASHELQLSRGRIVYSGRIRR